MMRGRIISCGALSLVPVMTLLWHPASAFVSPMAPLVRPTVSYRPRSVETTSLGRVGFSVSQLGAGNLLSMEDFQERLPSKAVIEAVEASSSGKVIASDVAVAAGVPLSQARRDLTALASLSRGDISVSQDGELLYTFPPNLSSVLSQNSQKYKLMQLKEKVWPKLFYGLKVSFGLVLVASLVAIFTTIFFVSQGGGSSDDDRRRDNRRGGGGMSFGGGFGGFWGPSPFDFFYYRPYYSGYYATPGQAYRDPDEMGFLESVFSYIFGDGNPNGDLEERRLSLVANLIRQNKGAVTAEQLAPFCDDAPEPSMSNDDATYVDESFVLPIVSKLNGEPRVTDDGDIVYVFPELQVSASMASSTSVSALQQQRSLRTSLTLVRAGLDADASASDIKNLLNRNNINSQGAFTKEDLLGILETVLPPMTDEDERRLTASTLTNDPKLLQEREFEFSLASGTQRFLSGALGAVNLLGALYLGNMFSQFAAYGVQLPSYYGVVQSLYPALLGYAVLFNVIPVVRNVLLQKENDEIRKRNKIRRAWRTALDVGAGSIRRKLQSARKMGTKLQQLGGSDDDTVFDTRSTMEEMDAEREEARMKDFDKLLGNNNDTSEFE
eukprot:scaffold49615_cov45-Attheya_sp.AAC.1